MRPVKLPPNDAVYTLFDFIEGVQFWIKDVQGRYRWVNRGFLMNYSLEKREQVVGKTDFDLSPPHLADQYQLDDKRVLRGESIAGRVELVGRFDHTSCWSVTHKVPLKDGAGKICGTAGITRPLDPRAAEVDVQDEWLGRVIARIRADCGRAWSNQEMAKEAKLSVRSFERHFQTQFGVSPQEYLRRLRVRMAAHALVYSELPLASIAEDFGFSDQSHFTREFKLQTAWTPRTYRKHFGIRSKRASLSV
jgi:AraC-like DNA-binding protein